MDFIKNCQQYSSGYLIVLKPKIGNSGFGEGTSLVQITREKRRCWASSRGCLRSTPSLTEGTGARQGQTLHPRVTVCRKAPSEAVTGMG